MSESAPDPEAMKQGIAGVFDRTAESYDQVGVDFFTPAGRDLVERVGLVAGERVLDVGTGRGAALFPAAEAVGPSGRAVGLDISARMAELTQAEAQARGLQQVSVLQGDAERPEFADASFDAVLGALVIFFLPDPAAALRHYARLLADGGRVGLTTFGTQDPNFDAAMRAIGSFIPGEVPDRNARQGPFGSRAGIESVLSANGFTDVQIDEASYVSRFADTDHWLSWVWSHGGRWTLERVPSERLDEACAAGKAAVEGARTPDGDYVISTEIRFTVARPASR